MYTLLHISDLHRSIEEPVDNSSLLAALLTDADRYIGELPRVPRPSALIISGDLVQGVRIGEADWRSSMKNQYKVASDFIVDLCNTMFEGDRSKVVIVPGNHDVCWNTSNSAIQAVPEDGYPSDLWSAIYTKDSDYRWSWRERKLYKIVDKDLYAQRLMFFWDFYEKFYENVPFVKEIDRTRGFHFYEICEGRVIVAAFDSTDRNDSLNYSGAIQKGVVARSVLSLRGLQKKYSMHVAVWHHSISGPPNKGDYMDVSQVHEMAGLGYQLGLHGHQHVAETGAYAVNVDQVRSMAVVSAGSLCAGSRELPRGVNRQYNLIVIEDGYSRGRVHVREMVEGGQFTRKSNGAFIDGHVVVSWQLQRDAVGRSIDVASSNIQSSVVEAEEHFHANRQKEALRVLSNIDLKQGSYARRLALEVAVQGKDWSFIIEKLQETSDVGEVVAVVLAKSSIEGTASALDYLDKHGFIPGPVRDDLRAQVTLAQWKVPK